MNWSPQVGVAILQCHVGAVVRREREHADAVNLLLVWLPIIWILSEIEGLGAELGHLGVGAGTTGFSLVSLSASALSAQT